MPRFDPITGQAVPPSQARAPAARAPKPTDVTLKLDAAQFTPLAGDELRRAAKGLGSRFGGAWFGRRDLIPPADDPRTRIIDRAMVTKVYKVLRQKKIETDQQTWNRRYREYTEKIKTGSILEIAKVLRDLFVLKGDKELSFGERKMLDTARNLLVKELSIARSHSEEKIMEELRHIFTH